MRSDVPLALDKKQLDYFASLIDWAHQNDLDFHVTEIDYKIWDSNNDYKALSEQADAYANILNVLLSKRDNGVVTFNTWGMVDGKKGNITINIALFLIKTITPSQHIFRFETQF